MIDGPKRAPSSPPETPQPTKFRRRSRSAASRRRVSSKYELPPSIRMSPASSSGESLPIISSTGAPAGTIIRIRRGRSSAATSASSVFAPGELRLRMVAKKGVGPLRLQVPDRHGEPVLLDVEREIAPHRPQSDDAERAPTHIDISRAVTSACSKARSRVRTPSSSPIRDAGLPSPRGTTRAAGSAWPSALVFVDRCFEACAPGGHAQ